MKSTKLVLLTITTFLLICTVNITAQTEFKLLATKKTSTMQKEMQEAADAGYRFEGVTGGGTSFGGSEVVVIMSRPMDSESKGEFKYRLLATKKTSTMQKEIQEAGDNGFRYKGQTVFGTFFGGDEVVIILEKDMTGKVQQVEYKLLATKKTSTMQKELNEAGEEGYSYVGVTVGKTFFGGSEVVVITAREKESAP